MVDCGISHVKFYSELKLTGASLHEVAHLFPILQTNESDNIFPDFAQTCMSHGSILGQILKAIAFGLQKFPLHTNENINQSINQSIN